ncbi:hypothetical protein LCGC14_1333360 [marine sediment metagenome]|uniref:Uncharacterized protein n=1 Tax=marine sediment metagenome TaxID=412755 RepID=A0A0F9NID4_9ZZZZ|nr:hypothetical protein [archaeon]
MGCKAQITDTPTIHNFSLDEMYDENYSLKQIYTIFKQLDKNWKTLGQKHVTLLEEIHDYLEENFYKCCVCGEYFQEHEFTNPDYSYHECYSCFTEPDF